MAYTITDLRTLVRYSARDASDSAKYSDTRIDWAIQQAMLAWARETKTPRQLSTIALTQGSATVGAFPTGFTPDLVLDVYLTLSGSVIKPSLKFTSISGVLSAQVDETSDIDATGDEPTTGRPTRIAFKNDANAYLDTLCDEAYTLNVWWQAPLTLWTPGGVGPTFNLSDESLLVIASSGAVYYLQKNEPENAALAQQCYMQFLAEAKRFAGSGAGGRGTRVLERESPRTVD
jgi:hypothetical protein